MHRTLPALLDATTAAIDHRYAAGVRLAASHALGRALGFLLRVAAHAVTGVRALRPAAPSTPAPRIYFANHASHGDVVLIGATLPNHARAARPVAGGDYWDGSAFRRWLGRHVFDVLAIDRGTAWIATAALARMSEALDAGDDLVLFPEGTRNTGESALLPFKCGLYYLGQRRPALELVPVWIDNAARAMPKGRSFPVPILCSVSYGDAMRVEPGEDKATFMRRAEAAVEALRPRRDSAP